MGAYCKHKVAYFIKASGRHMWWTKRRKEGGYEGKKRGSEREGKHKVAERRGA